MTKKGDDNVFSKLKKRRGKKNNLWVTRKFHNFRFGPAHIGIPQLNQHAQPKT